MCEAEAFGLVERSGTEHPRRRELIALTPAGRGLAHRDPTPVPDGQVFVFTTRLVDVPGVSAVVAVGSHQHLTALHDVIQRAFGWLDDHLYSFWLDGRFWGDRDTEFTSPIVPDEGPRTADVPIIELDLAVGARMAYIFDFGDDWRVQIVLTEIHESDGGLYPRVLDQTGAAPPQYPPLEED
jgi:Plasmid pRiA4b ORF-3-like protein